MNWSQTKTWSDLLWLWDDLTNWIRLQSLSCVRFLATVSRVMRCKAQRAPHDSAMVSCFMYLCSQKKQSEKGLVPKCDSNPAEPLWKYWVEHAAAGSTQWLWKPIKKRNMSWSTDTDSRRAAYWLRVMKVTLYTCMQCTVNILFFRRRSRNRKQATTSLNCHLTSCKTTKPCFGKAVFKCTITL